MFLIKKIVYVAENDTSALGVENYGFLKQKLRDDSIAQTIDTLINYEWFNLSNHEYI